MDSEISFIHLDPVGGIAGDMFLAAIVDLEPGLSAGALASMREAGLPDACAPCFRQTQGHGFRGHGFSLAAGADSLPARDPRYGAIRTDLEASRLAAPVKARAQDIFALLAEAEARVHGIAIDQVHFHELAAWDTLADVVGAAFVIDALGLRGWSLGPLPIGSGRIETEHGTLPVPAPATALLLEGFEVFDDGVAGERVTPTGAEILKHLAPAPHKPSWPHKLAGQGLGFGTKTLVGMPNCLRALAMAAGTEAKTAGRGRDQVGVIAFEVDDQTAEDLAIGLEKIRALDGVLDVTQAPVYAKKNRLATHIRVLCRPERIDQVIDDCLTETSTIGLRWQVQDRVVLDRALHPGAPGVKVAARPGGRTAKAEAAGLESVSGGHAGRRRAARLAEDDVLRDGADPDGDG